MTYQVGIDLGTTFTAAAVHRNGRSSIFSLGNHAAAVPSVVLLREDGTELTGEAAVRRAMTEPERVAREFKRRLGDPTPIIVGGAPYSAEQLMARLLKATLAEVEMREGSAPDRVAITHPANWGPYKIDLLNQAVRLAGLSADRVDLLTEPEAAAIHYATQERVEQGEVVAVYDLGGGTFDAAVLRRTVDGFEIIGQPEGIERMGGIDFDAAVFAHVNRALDGKLQELDPDDPMVVSGVARLREDCVDTKVALSSDTDATIPVLLPSLQTEVRITRNEFEALIRPSLADSIGAMHRALETAGITAAAVSKVLLVGGSSRIPLIGQLVSSELGRPVAVDADPKHSIALGAAAFAAASADGASATPSLPDITPAFEPVTPPTEPLPNLAPSEAEQLATPTPVAQQPTTAMPQAPLAPTTSMPAAGPASAPGATRSDPGPADGGSKTPLFVGAAIGVVALGVVGYLVFGGGGDDPAADNIAPADSQVAASESVAAEPPVSEPVVTDPVATEPPLTNPPASAPALPTDEELQASAAAAVSGIDPNVVVSVSGGVVTLAGRVDDATASAVLAAASSIDGVAGVDDQLTVLESDELCSAAIQMLDQWACVESATFDGTDITASFVFDDGDTPFSTDGGMHLHFFADSTDPAEAGIDGSGVSTGGGLWVVWDEPDIFTASAGDLGEDVERLCVRIARPDHSLESLDSGNCFPVSPEPADA